MTPFWNKIRGDRKAEPEPEPEKTQQAPPRQHSVIQSSSTVKGGSGSGSSSDNDPLKNLWSRMDRQQAGAYGPRSTLPVEDEWESEISRFEGELRAAASEILREENEKKAEASAQPGAADFQYKHDARVVVHMAQNLMRAWVCVLAPMGGGNPVTRQTLQSALTASGVVSGLDDAALDAIAEQQRYFKIFAIAKGSAPVDGTDGACEECFPREVQVDIQENEQGLADYRNLHLIKEVAAGTVICNITPPIPAVDGKGVNGQPIHGKPGKAASIPRGPNTKLSADGKTLVAAIDGHVLFEKDHFLVDQVLIINGNVDIGVGNLDYQGEILVEGDVQDGFTVKAKGNVTVKGMVEGARIISGGSIFIQKGMNGNGRGVLDAGEDVKCKFLESCTVHAAGSIVADSIIGSDVYCDAKVTVMNGKGAIIGGNFTVAHSIEAKLIGSKSYRETLITLGITPHMQQKKDDLTKKLTDLESQLEEMSHTISYLERQGDLKGDRKSLLNQHRLKKPLLQMQKTKTENQLRELEEQMSDYTACRVKCGTIFPPTRINIGSGVLTVPDVAYHCNIYYSEGDVVIGHSG